MTESDQLAQLAEAMTAAAAAIVEAPAILVSVTFDRIAAPLDGEIATPHVEITRATRTLVFSRGELRGENDRLLLSATAVHRL